MDIFSIWVREEMTTLGNNHPLAAKGIIRKKGRGRLLQRAGSTVDQSVLTLKITTIKNRAGWNRFLWVEQYDPVRLFYKETVIHFLGDL